ncbi:hypothetical protein PINS_up000955 [Pythium insidiosum]|nr:hypothetical protein PINS_up000955 [Pythium insidiosum]
MPPSAASSDRLAKNSGIPRPSRLPSRRFGAPWQRWSSTTVNEGNEEATVDKVGTGDRGQRADAVDDGRSQATDVFASTAGTTPTSREATPFSSPTRATRLREPGWLKRKRPREEIRSVFVPGRSLEDEEEEEEEDGTRRRAPPLSFSLLRAPSSVSSSQATAPATEDDAEQHEEHDAEEEQEQEQDPEVALKIATCLQRDLLRDRARLRLKIDSLRDDIEVYYELLARIETAALDAVAVVVEDDRDRALISRIQEIISARRPSTTVATEVVDEEPMDQEKEEELAPHEELDGLVEKDATPSTIEM